MITFAVDDFTPCLYDVVQQQYIDTQVIRIKTKKVLAKFNSRSGWYVNWSKFKKGIDVYAVIPKNQPSSVEGLVAIENDKEAKMLHIAWASVAPHNDVWKHREILGIKNWQPKYKGVGGHLLAIAATHSVQMGYKGAMHAEAMDGKLLQDHITRYKATPAPLPLFPYHFGISTNNAMNIIKEYDYENTEIVL